jgi:protein involved in polysaccharide export with SLBB domain
VVSRTLPILVLALTTVVLTDSLVAQGSAQATPPAVRQDGGDEPIRPGDVVRLDVYRHEDLTRDFLVNQYGTVSIGRLGEIDVTRETHRSLRERVIRELRETVVSSSIELMVLKRVRVLGEVEAAGLYLADPTMTVADVLALAGGSTSTARRGIVILRRDGETVESDLRVETRISDSRIRSGDELEVPIRSWLSRNSNAMIASVGAFAGLIVALVTAGSN